MLAETPHRIPTPLVLCALFLAVGSGACSYAFVDGPPKRHRQLPYFTCTTSRAWPVVDTVLSATYAIEAVGVASLASTQSSSTAGGTTAAVALGGAAVLFAASAVSGYSNTSACREATEELQVRLTRMQFQAAPGFGPAPQGPVPYQPPTPYDPWVTPHPGSFSAPPPPPSPPGTGTAAPTPKSKPAPEPEAPGEKPSKP